jgi:hypothetical protein
LASLLALQRSRRGLALALAAVTLACSALAFFFLGLTLVALAVSRRCARRQAVVVGVGMAALAACWLAASLLYPTSGRYPFAWWTLLIVVAVAGCGMALALRSPRARVMAAFFGLWLAGCVALYLVPTPMGEIVTRLRYIVFPLMLLTVLLGGNRPRWLAAITLAGALAYNVVPYTASIAVRVDGDGDAAEEAYWRPAIDFLTRNGGPDHLVEVVATGAHWEAYHLPRAGIPLVRGWYRQIDMVRNDVLYDASATPADYLDWLRANAVRFVVLPDVRLDPHTGGREARLVADRATGLQPVLQTANVTIYEVPQPTTLITGPAEGRVTRLAHAEVAGTVAAPGTYQLRLSWSPYWRVLEGAVTLEEDRPGGRVTLRATQPGPFRIAVRAGPFPG